MKITRWFCISLFACLLLPASILGQESQQAEEDQAIETLTLRDCMENLTVQGDLRVRYELRDLDYPVEPDETRDRMLARFRLGFVWKSIEKDWELGAGLATGGPSATSTQNTWSEETYFETGDIRLDYAYGKHFFGPVTFTAGQQKNPFETSWLLWDSDVRPAGFTLEINPGVLFLTLGGYDVIQIEVDQDFGILYAAQLGAEIPVQEDSAIILAVAYYDFDGDFDRQFRRENPTLNADYEYNVVDLYANAGLDFGDFGLTIYGQVFENIGADGEVGQSVLDADLDPEEENMGWAVGLEAEVMMIGLEYTYAELGADSFVPGLTDATFGSGVGDTDVRGHIISLEFDVTKCFSVGGNVYIYEALERKNEPEGTIYHADLNYKF